MATPATAAVRADPTASPARGKPTAHALLQKLRPPPLVHVWDFWFEKPALPSADAPKEPIVSRVSQTTTTDYTTTLTHLHTITDVRAFWSVLNNLPVSALPPGTALHLFHAHVKPIWEAPRNARGGAWSFRVPLRAPSISFSSSLSTPATPDASAADDSPAGRFWTDVCMLAVGEQLQAAVEQPGRMTFRDDICGVSLRVKARSAVVQVWNRDGGHEDGIKRILEAVEAGVSADVRVPAEMRYYKRHAEHWGFRGGEVREGDGSGEVSRVGTAVPVEEEEVEEQKVGFEEGDSHDAQAQAQESIRLMEEQVKKVRAILEEVKESDEELEGKLAAAAVAQDGEV